MNEEPQNEESTEEESVEESKKSEEVKEGAEESDDQKLPSSQETES